MMRKIETAPGKTELYHYGPTQFSKGIEEEVVPDVRLNLPADRQQWHCNVFPKPKILSSNSTEEITGMRD